MINKEGTIKNTEVQSRITGSNCWCSWITAQHYYNPPQYRGSVSVLSLFLQEIRCCYQKSYKGWYPLRCERRYPQHSTHHQSLLKASPHAKFLGNQLKIQRMPTCGLRVWSQHLHESPRRKGSEEAPCGHSDMVVVLHYLCPKHI